MIIFLVFKIINSVFYLMTSYNPLFTLTSIFIALYSILYVIFVHNNPKVVINLMINVFVLRFHQMFKIVQFNKFRFSLRSSIYFGSCMSTGRGNVNSLYFGGWKFVEVFVHVAARVVLFDSRQFIAPLVLVLICFFNGVNCENPLKSFEYFKIFRL